MSSKTRRILAWIALVFMVLFTASLIAWFFDRTLFNNAIGFLAIFTGGVGIGLFVVLHFSSPDRRTPVPPPDEDDGTSDDAPDGETETATAPDGRESETDAATDTDDTSER